MVSPPIAARRETNFRNGFVRFGASEVQHDEMELNRSFTGLLRFKPQSAWCVVRQVRIVLTQF